MPEAPVSRICQAYPDRVEVRTGPRPRPDGQVDATEYFHLLLTGKRADRRQRYFLDLLLVAIAEHGMMPTNVAARMTLAADPGSLQGALAAGILGAGPVILGTSESCARLLEAQDKVLAGGDPASVADELAGEMHAAGDKAPGLGIRSTGRSTRGPNASSSSQMPAGSAGPRPACASLPRCGRKVVGQAAHDECRHALRGGAARSGLHVGHREGHSASLARRRPAGASGRGAATSCRLAHGGRAEEAIQYEREPKDG